jgi:hypothetical protein
VRETSSHVVDAQIAAQKERVKSQRVSTCASVHQR